MQLRCALARLRYLCAAWLVAFAPWALAQTAAGGLCAEVKLEIPQKVSLERQAFAATMRINNGLESAIQNIAISLAFQDAAGNGVIATSDPNNTNASFFLAAPTLTGIGAFDGTGSVAAKTTGEIAWLIIPSAGAGGTQPQGKLYFIGATVSYTIGAVTNTVTVTPDSVTVLPQPRLTLDYFLQRDVYADDPLTPQVEPAEPFTLGVRVKNTGGGVARSTTIESAQPRIVENQQGLAIGFQILDSFVNDQPAAKTLLASFGDVAPASSKVARWNLVTTLAGKVTDFSATFTHADALGGVLTSLIQSVATHLLVHDVKVEKTGRDSIRDFLALDGTTLRVYESEGIDSVVTDQSAAAQLQASGGGLFAWTLPASSGMVYAKVADPYAGRVQPGALLRSDGRTLSPQNVWLSKSRNADLSWSYFINLFDVDSTGSYRLALTTPTPNASIAGVVYNDANRNGVKDAGEAGLGAVAVTLTGTDTFGAVVSAQASTSADGSFGFTQLAAGTYALQVASIAGFNRGPAGAGTAGGVAATGVVNTISLAAGAIATGYAFSQQAIVVAPTTADLALALSANAGSVQWGDTVAFHYTLTNAGPATATAARVNSLLPAGLIFVAATASSGSYDAVQGVWNAGDLASGANVTLDVTVRVQATGTLNLTGAAASSVTDPATGNNSAGASVVATARNSAIKVALLASHAEVGIGESATVLVSISNTGPDAARIVTIGLNATALSIAALQASSGSFDPASGTWTVSSLAVGASVSLLVQVSNAAASASLAGSVAQVNGSAPATPATSLVLFNALNCNCADLTLQVVPSAPTAAAGASVDWLITASNRGPSTAVGVVASVGVPAAIGVTSADAAKGTYGAASGQWTIGTLFAGEAVTLTLRSSVGAVSPAIVTATIVAADQTRLPFQDVANADNTAQGSINAGTVPAVADLNIAQSVSDAQPGAGAPLTFTLTASNAGPLPATGVTVAALLPANFALTGATPSQGGFDALTGIWNVGNLPAGAAASLSVQASASGTLAASSAALIFGNQPDASLANNLSRLLLNAARSDVAVGLTATTLTPNPGQSVALRVTAHNAGPDAAAAVLISAVVPSGLTLAGAVPSQGDYDALTGLWQVGSLNANDDATLILTVTPDGPASTTVAARLHALATIDGNVANNESTLNIVSTPHAVLTAIATVSQAVYPANGTAQVSVQVTNSGAIAAQNIAVNVLIANSKGAQTHTATQNIAALGTSANATLLFSFPLIDDDADSYTVSVTGADGAGDSMAPATATYSVLPPPPSSISGLVFADASANGQYEAGEPGLAAVTLTLSGVDSKNAPVSRTTTTDAQGAFAFTGLSAGTYAVAVGPLPTYVDTVALPGPIGGVAATGTISSIALASGVTANGNAFAKRTQASFYADVSVSVTASTLSPVQFDVVVLTVRATNAGPATAQSVIVTDVLPSGMSFVGAVPSVGTYNAANGVWSVGNLANGASATLVLSGRITTLNPVVNAAGIASSTYDANATNDSASVNIRAVAAADLSLSMAVDQTSPSVNTTISLTLVVSNAGPSTASAVAVTDLLPAGLSFLSANASVGAYSAPSGIWNLGDLASGASATLNVQARVVSFGSIGNNASVASTTSDPNAANNTASVTFSAVGADLALTMSVDRNAPVQYDPVAFTLTVTNAGPATALSVQVNDQLPGGFTFISASPSAGTYASGSGVWSVGNLASSGSATLVLRAKANVLAALTNTATASSSIGDPNTANNTASVAVSPVALADVAVTHAAGTTQPVHNSAVALTVTLSNAGPSTATAVVVTDLLPAGLTLLAANATIGAYNGANGQWSVGDLAAGGSATLSLSAKVTTLASVTLMATAAASTNDPATANNSASVTLNPLPEIGYTVQTALVAENRVLVLASCAGLASQNDAQCAAGRAVAIGAYLGSRGYDYRIVTDAPAFRAELRCGHFNSFWVSGASANEIDQFADELQAEILRGAGLLLDGIASVNSTALEAAAGTTFGGALSTTTPLITINGADFTAGTFTPTGTPLTLKATTGTTEATISARTTTHSAIVVNRYGAGRGATFGFDLVGTLQAQGSVASINSLPASALRYLVPDLRTSYAGGELVLLSAIVRNTGDNATVQVIAMLPPATSVAGTWPTAASISGNQITWNVTLAAGQTQALDLGMRLPFASGTSTVNYSVRTVQGGNATPYGTYSQTVVVQATDQLLAPTIGVLQALSLSKKADQKARDNAVTSLQSAQTALGAGDYDSAIQQYVGATVSLETITAINVQPYQSTIAGLLHEASRRWCTQLIACGTADVTPQPDAGLGFTAFSSTEGLNARGGGSGAQNWEWALGADTQKSGLFVSSNQTWVTNRPYAWTLNYDGAGNGSYTVKDGTQTLFTASYASTSVNPLHTGNALGFSVAATANAGTAKMLATVTSINGQTVTGGLATAGNNQPSTQSVYYYFPALATGFTAKGTLALNFTGNSPPATSNLLFTVNAGNTACFASGQ